MNLRRKLTQAALLAAIVATSAPALGGVILISTRYQQDTQYHISEYYTDEKGPGMVTPGDAAMGSLLGDHGYSFRIVLDRLLGAQALPPVDPSYFLITANTNMAPVLAIMSGSGASADTPPPPPGVPIMMGEHVCLGNNAGRLGSLYMYNGTGSSDPNSDTTPAVSKYMKVIDPEHPIMKGIPLDDQGRVKIFRDRYPEEELNVPTGGKKNYEWRWCTQVVADKAAGTTVLGVLDGAEDRSCLAVMEVGGTKADESTTDVRLVHMFMNENGSGGSRRVFNALTDLGRIIFLRSAKWAMGEQLTPYKSFKILDITPGGQKVTLKWEGEASHNYRLVASDNLVNWSTVVEDIPGVDGTVTREFDISAAPQTLFLQIASLP